MIKVFNIRNYAGLALPSKISIKKILYNFVFLPLLFNVIDKIQLYVVRGRCIQHVANIYIGDALLSLEAHQLQNALLAVSPIRSGWPEVTSAGDSVPECAVSVLVGPS